MQKKCSEERKAASARSCVSTRETYQDKNYANVKVFRTKNTSFNLNISETVFPSLEKFQV